ncbi:MAG: peptidoglycan editing factor PgeF [bacterium]|nr:peptidoglycan editing factor PgeF [bacterium]
MADYELAGRRVRSLSDRAGDCGQGDFSVQVGADLVSAELIGRVLGRETERFTVQYISFSNIPIPHGCSTRIGGVSSGAYESLNIGQSTADAPSYVHENRRRLGMAVGVMPVSLLDMNHGTRVVRFDQLPRGLHKGDACITNVPGLPLMITTADCVPLIMYDTVHKAVGLTHAGWRGTVAKISQYTLQAMHDNYGTDPADVQAAVGPSIGPCCFEVGPEVAEQFREAFPQQKSLIIEHLMLKSQQELLQKKENILKLYINLWRANLLTLLEAGIPAGNIRFSGLCTMCNRGLFYSYRRDQRVTGRIATLAMLPE